MAFGRRSTSVDEMLAVSRDQKSEMVRNWIEDIPLSRPKKHIGRDLADAVIAAEIIRFYLPRLVEIHNYVPSHNAKQKTVNWKTLNRKSLAKLNFEVPDQMITDLVASKSEAAEDFLLMLRDRIFAELEDQRRRAQAKALNPANSYLDDMRQDSYDAAVARARKRLLRQENAAAGPSSQHHMNYGTLPPMLGHRHAEHHPQATSRTWPGTHGATETYEDVSSAGDSVALDPESGTGQLRNRGWQGSGPDINIVLEEKEQTILELQETVQLMSVKVRRLEGLLRVKDLRIEDLTTRLQNLVTGASPERPPRRKL